MTNLILKCAASQLPVPRRRFLRAILAPIAIPTIRLARRASSIHAQPKTQGGLGDEDLDVAVFRFTLGIPGFDDRLIPRVVGVVLGAFLFANHLAGAQPTPDAQLRSEWLGALLAALCVLVPDIEERLREVMPGRGRQKTAEAIEGASNCFFLDPSLPEAAKKELAWASFSLLKNTNCCGLLAVSGRRVLLARGALGSRVVIPGDSSTSLEAISRDLEAAGGKLLQGPAGSQLWLPERSDFRTAALEALQFLPNAAQCLLVQSIQGPAGQDGALVVFSERPRSLTDRERVWVAAIGQKLSAFL